MQEILLLGIFLERQEKLADVVGFGVDDGREALENEDRSSIIVQSVLLHRLHADRHERLQFGLGAYNGWVSGMEVSGLMGGSDKRWVRGGMVKDFGRSF